MKTTSLILALSLTLTGCAATTTPSSEQANSEQAGDGQHLVVRDDRFEPLERRGGHPIGIRGQGQREGDQAQRQQQASSSLPGASSGGPAIEGLGPVRTRPRSNSSGKGLAIRWSHEP